MPTTILMPALSPTMTEGTLARWLKKEGEAIRAGDVIAEIETDKATMEVEAVDEGVLGKILIGDGTANVAVNAPIAVLVNPGESIDDAATHPAAGAQPAPAPKEAPPVAKPDTPGPTAGVVPAANGHPSPRLGDANLGGAGRLVFASPLARRLAGQAGIDLASLKGTGPNGRIVKADIEAARDTAPVSDSAASTAAPNPASVITPHPAAPVAAPVAPKPALAPHTLQPHSTMRRVIARRLTDAKATIPHFYVSIEIVLDPLIKLRGELNARSPQQGPGAFKLSINDLVIKAAAVTLRRVPRVNASWTEEGIALFNDVDISVAVSIPDGLITPIIRRADQKGLAAISAEMKDLATRAKAGKLKPEEFQGGGFSISNMGMFGVSQFSAILNPPQAAILAVSAGLQQPVVRDGALAIATVMTCTLSVDHRVIDGALGAEWLAAFKTVLEAPLGLML